MYEAFKLAFDDYPVPFSLSKPHFIKKFIEKLNLNFELSAGAFENNKLIGFIFTSLGNYNNLLTAYNGGTGVIPAFRGREITYKMYDFLMPKLRARKISQCILEVLVNNPAATHIYKQIGFNINRNFKCFKLDPLTFAPGRVNKEIEIHPLNKPDWKIYTSWLSVAPSYLDTIEMINQNLQNEYLSEATINGRCVGFIIFQPALGRISQICVDPRQRKKGIGSALVLHCYHESKNKSLTLINVENEAGEIVSFFTNQGFQYQLDQYEMELRI
jgi:ribosomal protein S18 acetylase RimI-like enzyme